MAAVYRLEVPLQGAASTSLPGAAEFWSGLDRRSRVLTASVTASLLLHAILLSTQFKFPAELRWKSGAQAQVNLDGGGDTDQPRRATSPLPVIDPRNPGRDLAQAERRVRELELQQRKLLAQPRRT